MCEGKGENERLKRAGTILPTSGEGEGKMSVRRKAGYDTTYFVRG